jgi:hypothetical protein
MPPQQVQYLLDFGDRFLDFGTHGVVPRLLRLM